ncbi:nucleotide exchange factor GrpE [Altererythrobacter soli]|uniref:Protein GrpE n=1 Tax=Croceibacterium soli TaxID=1739690 RepID=A0A6I4UW33_9SPHN|nr:nucleotide exchange factor GrpE [Croceibacterium soli]MXP42796.1 nucleotide exchange factor GrpE [Croceibacterium soli]
MINEDKSRDAAVEEELKGVPEDLIDEESMPENQDSAASEEIARLTEELAAAKQDVLYAKADAQNVRRRADKDVADARTYAVTGFARDVLSIADNLSRAIEAIPEDLREDSKFKGLVAGIQATQRELDKVFTQHGITRIAAVGLPLDPNQHQAMLEMPTDDAEPGTIVQEMQAGYMIRERLLRPAMVAVAKKPE